MFLIRFFDYMFYRVSRVYKNLDSTPDVFGVMTVSLFQQMNAISLIDLFEIFNLDINPSKQFLGALYLVFGIPNCIRYFFYKKYEHLEEKYEGAGNSKTKRSSVVVIYIVLSIIVFISLLILGRR